MMKDHVTEPLLYIEQPEMEKPKAVMQEVYDGQVEKKVNKTEKQTKSEYPDEKYSTESFQRLSIPEKITYLLSLPTEMPRLKCRIHTKEATYSGIVLEEENEEIIFLQYGHKRRRINKKAIEQIQLLGF